VFRAVIAAGLMISALSLAGCSILPDRDAVVAQANQNGEIAFSVVKINEAVIDVLAARPRPAFGERFKKYQPAPELKIAVGDTVSVVIWEAAANGLFGNSLTEFSRRRDAGSGPATERLVGAPDDGAARIGDRTGQPARGAGQAGRPGTAIPDQPVGPDGAITIPYAGRVSAAGRTATELGRRIEALLGPIAIDPQALVIVRRGAGSMVTVAGEGIEGRRVPLAPGGTRLLEVIAAAGGATTPVHETFVRLTRDGVSATAPLAELVANPDQNIFARPGDVLILSRAPQTLSVFGAAGRNASITFGTERLSLSEALAKAGGLPDQRADPGAIFVMRHEPAELARALDQPVAASAPPGLSPVVYRLDLADAKSYLLAERFPVQDRDIIFVAEAKAVPITRALRVLSQITGPVTQALLACQSSGGC
jgi:polysaccharide export outer membrane protein